VDRDLKATPIVAGEAGGPVLVSSEPLSFWGGYDPKTGEIIDRRHPLSGQSAAGTVLALPFTRGSSTSTAILLESVRTGHAPAAILSTTVDPFLALASVVARELYDADLPILVITAEQFAGLATGMPALIGIDGTVRLGPAPE